MSTFVRFALDGPVARITLDRPPLNILTTAMMQEFRTLLEQRASAADVRLVRIDALGKVFCAGVDVGEHEGDALPAMMDALHGLFEALGRVEVPIVSVVHGAALGGGCELVLGTDVCLASERASFGQPEVRLGLFAPPATALLPRIAGERRALAFLLTGEALPASEAQALGIVHRVFPEASFAQDAEAWIGRLLELSGAALRMVKRAVLATRGLGPGSALSALDRLYREELMQTEDAREGLRAFLEKRPPKWKHR